MFLVCLAFAAFCALIFGGLGYAIGAIVGYSAGVAEERERCRRSSGGGGGRAIPRGGSGTAPPKRKGEPCP